MAKIDIARMTDAEHREFASFARMYGSQWKKQIRQRRMDGRLSGPAATAFNKIGPSGLIAYRLTMANKIANPSASCPRQSPKFNAYQGRTVKYRKKSYEIEGCGIGRTAKRSIGKQEEGTYALRALKTGRKKYVAKRVIRDLAYHRGGKAILGMPKRKKAVKNPSKRGKLHGAAKAEVVARMAAGRRRAGR